MRLENIPLSDIFPNEKNPRTHFEGIDELAASFENGEPFTPITVVQDGGIYTLIDGERRYRAMRKLGTKRCRALVAETQDDADVLVAMVSTNNKQQLDNVELSRGIQQALLFSGVERVERASGKKNLRRVGRAVNRVGDAAEDMSIDRLLAIDENADNPALVEALTNCKESEWRAVLADAKSDSKPEEATQEASEEEALRGELDAALTNARVCLAALASRGYDLSVHEQRLLTILDEIERRRGTW